MAALQKLKMKAAQTASGATAITYPPATVTFNGNAVKQVKHSDGTILWGKYNCYSAAEEIDYVVRDAWESWDVHTGDDVTSTLSFAADGVNAKRTLEEDLVYTGNSFPSHPVYHGEQVTLAVYLAQGWNFGINEIDQATAYWITEKQMTRTAEGDISWQLDSDWMPTRNYLQALTFSGSGCTLSSFTQSNASWTNGSKATSGATITFTARPITTGMVPASGTYSYTVPEANSPNATKIITFYAYWPMSYSGTWTPYGPNSSSQFKNNLGNEGFGGTGSTLKVALYTNNTSWVSMNSIRCQGYSPSATTSTSPTVISIPAKGNVAISYSAQAGANSSGQLYGYYYYNSKLYKITLKTNSVATITQPSVTINNSSLASNFAWNYDQSAEQINWTRAGFAVTNTTGVSLVFTVKSYGRFLNNLGNSVSFTNTSQTTLSSSGTIYESNGYDYGGASVSSFNVVYEISVKMPAGETVVLGTSDEIH